MEQIELLFDEELITEQYKDLDVVNTTNDETSGVNVDCETVDDWIDLN